MRLYPLERSVREHREIVIPFRTQALRHGPDKILITPVSNASFRIGGDVCSVKGSERCFNRSASGKKSTVIFCVSMATAASGGLKKIFAGRNVWC